MNDFAHLDAPGRIRAEFFFDEDLNRDLCKISIIGDTGNLLKKVTPDVIAQYPKEWELYQKQSGRQQHEPVGGTPLREIPGVDRDAATVMRYHAIRNAEELAALDEDTVRKLGAGFLNFWRSAKLMMQANEAAQLRELLKSHEQDKQLKRKPGRPRKEPEPEIEPEQPDLGTEAA